MQINPEHEPHPPPPPFTEEEWYNIACCIGILGGLHLDDTTYAWATAARDALHRVVGKEYITYLRSLVQKMGGDNDATES